jgi:hypothetical protein
MTTSEIVTVILTSAVISSVVAFLLNYFFESRQQHRFEKEIADLEHNYAIQLEKLKTEMVIGADIQHEITERRLSSYPKLVELVYRTRNMARELVGANHPPAFAEELEARSSELEDCLYRFRIDLERDGTFGPIHAYKNLLKTFNLALKDAMFYQSRDAEQDKIQQGVEQLESTYRGIEALHKSIIDKLSESIDDKTG